ncbi:histone-like nucleoid-structuring protein Lsr2 [Kitasatospora sp. NPDC053057]|uniref:Lsr2 family DNA-binding protein n=1 Tax=Kitasatospora sp. NPDC053057 TaxID=3364062 RepID=UPI0037CA3AC5
MSDTLTTEPADQGDVLANLDPMTREVALSMRYRGDSPLKILAATGLTEAELQALAARHPQTEAGPGPEFGTAVDELLAWGAQHPQAKVQRLADQARQALEKLAGQREADQAVATYEQQVATLKAQLASAEQALRDAKAGKPATSASIRATSAGRTAGSAELAQPADKTVRNTIRAWANQHGHPVADRGVIPQTVLRAWYDAHPDALAQAS